MDRSPAVVVFVVMVAAACGGRPAPSGPDGADASGGDAPGPIDARVDDVIDAAAPDATTGVDAAGPDAAVDGAVDAGPGCLAVDDTAGVVVGVAAGADDYALALIAASASPTRWSEAGNEAVVLEVTAASRGVIGHLVLHQGHTPFTYTMHLGALAAGEALSVRVSPLSAPAATPAACVTAAVLTPATAMGSAAEGLRRAPIFRWPAGKRFDDLPVLVGWSAATRSYQAVYTHENGGTVASCGMEAELARWGRGCDIERVYGYDGASPPSGTWSRCTGTTTFAPGRPRLEGDHPTFYYGDGHNRLFEHRGGYGRTCGSGGAERADGDLAGWNVDNPGNDADDDGAAVITLRPLPVDLDALGFAAYAGRREALVDVYAPWIYRLTFLELEREGRVDGVHTAAMDRYLYVDIHAADVDGAGDRVCAGSVSKGFMLRVVTRGGATLPGPQMTASYFGADDDWKRLAIRLDAAYQPADVASFVFDAYDDDGIYLLALGDAFLVQPDGDNGATLARVHTGVTPIEVYVDDDRGGCVADHNDDGPGGVSYPCTGSDHAFTP